MTSIAVNRIVPLTYNAMRVTDDYLPDLLTLISQAQKAGLWQGEARPVDTADGAGGWLVTIRYADSRPDLFAHPGYWVVADHDLNIEVYDPASAGAWYHDDVDWEWVNAGRGAVAPIANVIEDGNGIVEVVFRQPESLNGPWSYVVQREAVIDHATADFTVTDPVVTPLTDDKNMVIGALVSVHLDPQLVPGTAYTFGITATDGFGKTATSLPTDTVRRGA